MSFIVFYRIDGMNFDKLNLDTKRRQIEKYYRSYKGPLAKAVVMIIAISIVAMLPVRPSKVC